MMKADRIDVAKRWAVESCETICRLVVIKHSHEDQIVQVPREMVWAMEMDGSVYPVCYGVPITSIIWLMEPTYCPGTVN